ncbi:unnamed protein product [Penicillium nalgiovense]|uniref:Superoxide dismutase [Cu-Zn] n=1 Tax=Penicillium nalgiovense TaxID=60175 RepID=A0A9W4MWP8_PENNA|nr:unnamed protein product [Penicillium nalgiovense]CAG7960515.1 unnamed protein product [Penicillium nalgiovense]CAG7975110.1 unnamed protein product [Penicillium nalgiovense]CAG8010595.1 unnamed protein product [Penicillium nalgiovense]CAG8011121.1 unnamed protein product [Penicillium nalgiovense]
MMGANYINFKATELVGSIRGTLTLEERNNGLVIEGQLSGIPVGKHGIHVHEYGSTGNECLDAGGHYNPTNVSHGAPTDAERHIGDWGNIDVDQDPYMLSFSDHVAKLTGPYGIRSIVIHRDEDDLGRGNSPDSKINGNSGPRLACGMCLVLFRLISKCLWMLT